jgi:hypothetical protein
MDKYQYKSVLVCPVASWFRGVNLEYIREKLLEIENKPLPLDTPLWSKLRNKDDLEYCLKLEHGLSTIKDFSIRVEHPLISLYSNNIDDIISISNIDPERVKYVSKPGINVSPRLEKNTVFLPKIKYGFKITLGKSTHSHENFIEWAGKSEHVKLTKSCIRDLSRSRSWGGSYFYARDERSITMVRMFLTAEISRIDRVINDLPQ